MLLPALRLTLLTAGLCLTVACGQKGPLYLPQDEPPAVQTNAPCRAVECNESETDDMETNETPE